jgi:hypothetical protein
MTSLREHRSCPTLVGYRAKRRDRLRNSSRSGQPPTSPFRVWPALMSWVLFNRRRPGHLRTHGPLQRLRRLHFAANDGAVDFNVATVSITVDPPHVPPTSAWPSTITERRWRARGLLGARWSQTLTVTTETLPVTTLGDDGIQGSADGSCLIDNWTDQRAGRRRTSATGSLNRRGPRPLACGGVLRERRRRGRDLPLEPHLSQP